MGRGRIRFTGMRVRVPLGVLGTQPAAKATAVARWWKQTVRIHYANGSWEWGYYRWWGHADSRTSPTVWVLLNGATQQSAWALIGARIEVVGLPYPGN
jgi:hypothetical protein